uniref:Transposase n=1 Tax=Globodera pallida TaxID=36090 RepID=A0A183BU44_GLOPA
MAKLSHFFKNCSITFKSTKKTNGSIVHCTYITASGYCVIGPTNHNGTASHKTGNQGLGTDANPYRVFVPNVLNIGREYRENREQFNNTAREWTRRHAM